MSTIKSSAENLTLNADGANNDIKFQSNGSEVASIDQAGTVTATTFTGAATDATKLPLAGGTMTGTITSTHATALQLTNNTTSKIHFGDSGNASIGKIEYVHSSNHLSFKVNDAEKVRIHSNGVTSVPNGIELGSGTDATAANTLDDYEEGTWTPSFGADNQGFTIGSTAASTGKYIKIGKLVHFQMYVNITGSTPTSQGYRISGLPFANNSSTYAFFPIGGTYSGANANAIHDKAQWRLDHNGTTFRFYIASENALKDGNEAWGGSNTEYSFNVSGTYMMTI
jgi:hypothetical protein